jgi:hypothetical protein
VFAPDQEAYTTVNIHVPREQELVAAACSVLSPDGRYRAFGKEVLTRTDLPDGTCAYKFALPAVAPGSVVTRTWVVRQPNGLRNSPTSYEIPLQAAIPCRKARFSLSYPSEWSVAVKRLADGRPLPASLKEDRRTGLATLACTLEDLPAVTAEPYSPCFQELAASAVIHFKVIRLSAKGYYPIHWQGPEDWKGLASDFKDFVVDMDPAFNVVDLRERMHELTDGCPGDREKLAAIITWLQDHIERRDWFQVHQAGMELADSTDVLNRRQGSPAQITGLAMSLLRLAGLDSRYLLLHSAQDGPFDPEFISYQEFGIPALQVAAGGRSYVVLPWWRRMPIDLVPEDYLGQPALAIDRKGRFEFIQVPLGNQAVNRVEDRLQVALQADGKVRVEQETVLEGAPAFQLRWRLDGASAAARVRMLMERLPFRGARAVLEANAVENQDDLRAPLKIRLVYRVDDLLAETAGEWLFDAGDLFAPAPPGASAEAVGGRRNPVLVPFDESRRRQVSVTFPESWSVAALPADTRLENGFGRSSFTWRAGAGRITADCILDLRKGSGPPESHAGLQALISRKAAGAAPALVFRSAP